MLTSDRRLFWYTLFKYTVYTILLCNIVLFLFDDYAAARVAYGDDFGSVSLISLFPSTVDTAAWVVLLLLFEAETWIISDARLKNWRVQYSLIIGRAVAAAVIVYAFYGYSLTLAKTYMLLPLADPGQLCELAAQGYQRVISLGEFEPIGAGCATLADSSWWMHRQQMAVGSGADWQLAQRLAWLDFANAGAWLLIVVMLEADVWLQVRGRLTGPLLQWSRYAKLALYAILAIAVVAWLWMGDYLSGWDATIWLVAFVFIEMNLFQWQAELSEQQGAQKAARAGAAPG